MKAYFQDATPGTGIHAGHVEHEELELTDEELKAIKGRAVRAVTMDGSRTMPAAYRSFLDGGHAVKRDDSYAAFLKGER